MNYVLKRYPTLVPALWLAAFICAVVFIGGLTLGFIPPIK
jgi:peptidoglycan/LPS O-acetylase OafA/YrhL